MRLIKILLAAVAVGFAAAALAAPAQAGTFSLGGAGAWSDWPNEPINSLPACSQWVAVGPSQSLTMRHPNQSAAGKWEVLEATGGYHDVSWYNGGYGGSFTSTQGLNAFYHRVNGSAWTPGKAVRFWTAANATYIFRPIC